MNCVCLKAPECKYVMSCIIKCQCMFIFNWMSLSLSHCCTLLDRLRDTLIHEMCHAATWLINGVQDGHGNFWRLYARKATVAHPELPMVTRCHSYEIKYKFQYQCTRCQNTYVWLISDESKPWILYHSLLVTLHLQTGVLILSMILHRIGRHSKSLDTQRFVCALCTGQLVLLTPSKPRAPTPFANFVKENYGTVRQELAGQSHAEVMRKLSADFASKTKLSQSWDAEAHCAHSHRFGCTTTGNTSEIPQSTSLMLVSSCDC